MSYHSIALSYIHRSHAGPYHGSLGHEYEQKGLLLEKAEIDNHMVEYHTYSKKSFLSSQLKRDQNTE